MLRSRFLHVFTGCFCAAAVAFGIAPARAVDFGSKDGSQFVLGVGGYDVLHNYTAGLFNGEYRLGTGLWLFKPFVGVEATTKGSVYGYAGLGMDIYLSDSWIINPNAAVGAWSRGDGKELGSTIEFRTGGELDYRFSDASRLGVSFHHISNAGIGKHNPGEEEAMAIYSLPLSLP